MSSETIDITGTDLRALVARAYELSSPKGMGYLHFKEGGLSDAELDALLAMPTYATRSGGDGPVVQLDYVKGRACKLTVWRQGERLLIDDRWFDHTAEDLAALLSTPRVVVQGAQS